MKYGTGSFSGDNNDNDIKSDILAAANPQKADDLAWFFKTGPGEYGEGDKFLGIIVPKCRKIAGVYYQSMSLDAIIELLHSQWHEERQIALFMLVLQYDEADTTKQQQIYELYLSNTKYINNWDLVDGSAPKIVGQHIYKHPGLQQKLDKLAESKILWERRIAVISTLYFTANNNPEPTLRIVAKLLTDKHDLIQKANGWMLREVGKRIDEKLLIDFLRDHYDQMPRTTLRYAIEKFNPITRAKYMTGKF